MTPRRSSELEISPPSPFRTPEKYPTGGGQNRRKKSREERDSFLSSIFGSHSRPSSPSYDPTLQSMNNLAARSSKRGGLVRKLSAGNVKSGLLLPDDDEPRRKSFDSLQPNMNTRYGDFPPEEIAPFVYQTTNPADNRKGSFTTLSSNSDTSSYRITHRRTKSSDSDSALDSSSVYSIIHPIGKEKEKRTIFSRLLGRKNPKDKETSTSEGIHRKNSDAETYTHSHPNLIITPFEKDDFAPTTPGYSRSTSLTGKSEKSDHHPWRLKKGNSGRRKETTQNEFNLDIDDMDGIIRNDNREHRLSGVSITCDEMLQESSSDWTLTPTGNAEMWSPPESWAVRKPQQLFLDNNIMDDTNNENLNSDNKMYCIRIFRPDATFGTVNCFLNTPTAELCHMLGKKFFIQDISKYNLYVKRHNLERVLLPKERPLKLQKQLLEQAGYTENDKLDDLGREDNSYLFRFTFRETTVPRFEEEQGALSSIQHVDLQARNLQTIPIFLYRQAYFIRSLNVSQNLMLDLPTDFIQSCHQLKELHLSQNELERVPQSVKQSQMLSTLNLSSNRLRDLDHTQLENVTELTNLQADNNLLTSLPKSFAKFRCLNILNVANNSFTEFPPVICDIISLSELDLSFNKITSVPMEIGNLVHLKRLFLIGNQITGSLPTSFSNLTSLQKLDIRRNQLTNIDVLSLVPNLQVLLIESNNVSIVKLSSSSLQKLILPKNMLTQFSLMGIGTSITDLSLAYSKLIELPDKLFEDLVSLEKLDLSNNQLTKIPNSIGSLKKLAHFSCTNNTLSALPSEIGSLTALRVLDIHNNNLSSLPPEIWYCAGLVTLNVSSNLLEQFPMRPTSFPDVNQSNSVRPNSCLSNALRALYLGDNSLTTDIFSAISLFNELRILNLSFNLLDEIPTGGIVNPHLTELYLSGNEISSLPDDIEKLTSLRVLHVNGNKLQTLPAELSKIRKLVVLDVGNNALKYNIANWHFEWNWNWNIELKYLNLSGNKRLKIKHALFNELNPPRDRNLADFGALTRLRVLGLMDITLLDLIVPDETDNRRVRTSGSEVNSMSYGMADTLGTSDNLSTWEAVIPKFRGREDECLFGLFEGRAGTNRGGRVTKYLHDYFQLFFKTELEKLKDFDTVESALRRSFLSLNKELGLKVFNSNNTTMELDANSVALGIDDNKSGASGIVVYISGMILYVANIGDTKAVIGRNNGNAYEVASNQSIISPNEIERIREAGGFISHDCLVNGEVNDSRSFGHFHLTPIINANPSIEKINLSEQDEFIILATHGLWDRMSYQTAVDVTRTERDDLMRAAQKLRDFAISYGAEENIMVMIIGVGDLFDRRRRRRLGDLEGKGLLQGMGGEETTFYFGNRTKRSRRDENPSDSTIARLQKEIPPPIGQVSLVFTDIKNSTFLWETIPDAMRSAIKQHNTIMRRQLRNIGGYEVKTEGDAFMVSFPAVSSALLWCFTVQLELLNVDWPREIIDSEDGKIVYGGADNDLIYKGLSVRMGIHWGSPVCEPDIVTKRMDYFGPMVNRAARICNNADGGQICISSDVEAEIGLLHGMMDGGDNDSIFLKKPNDEEVQGTSFQSNNGVLDKNLIHLRKLGFVMRKIGERKLKGLENPEVLSLVYPEALKGRMEEDLARDRISKLYDPQAPQSLNPAIVKMIGQLCLRLERLSSGNVIVRNPRNSRLDLFLSGLSYVKDNATEEELLKIMESLVTRIENSISTLSLTQFALGDMSIMDIVKALQMYAQYMGKV
ncbi:PP2C-domain-containing protein [Rhizophagus irregularis]|uniref:Adenylate cyclase n=1 Tax=Rhizophagus irregularis TaxID=588596 RepID=A0A2N1NTM0_9GLOM|nr:PP2C-domain-containing protein [Rhizophagus irregularis]